MASHGTSKLQTIQHFTHNHPLTQVNGIGTYTCNGCKMYGEGKTYRCSYCDYDLHEYCATCPQTLINSCHGPDHELNLYSGPTHMTERSCSVCRVYIQGMFYICKQCRFESHPLCSLVSFHSSSSIAALATHGSLHDHAGQPSWPHGQANPYGYPHMGWSVPNPYGGHDNYHHQHQHHQHLYMNTETEPKPDSGTPKKKRERVRDGFKEALSLSADIASSLFVASATDSN